MNYRHAYHAGNFADVVKHLVLTLCLDYLRKKESPLRILDAHGGAGFYDLAGPEAEKTREWERGIGCLKDAPGAPPDLLHYLDLVRDDLARGQYPGSPLLIARQLRRHDRLIANELHEPTYELLEAALKPYANARATRMDAYAFVRAQVPPKERRGLVLIDPPFEKKDEFETLGRQIAQWKKRWATGVFLVWYPIKAHLPVNALKEAARASGFPRAWVMEVLISPRDRPESFNGCGLIVFNTPYTVPERVEALLPYLKANMELFETVSEQLVSAEQ